MADGSWENGGHGQPVKAGLPLWGKIAIGCGVAFLLVLVTCVGGTAFLVHKAKQDPDWFKKKAKGAVSLAAEKIRPDWEDFQAVVEQLRSSEGCKALYAANPELAKTWATEAEFLEVASQWRKDVVSAPELSMEVMEQGLHINYRSGKQVSVGWSPKTGRSVYVTFEGTRKSGERGSRRVLELDVR
jgi:hypothetical protein